MATVLSEKPGIFPQQQGQPGGPPPQYVQPCPPQQQYGQPMQQYGQPSMQQPVQQYGQPIIQQTVQQYGQPIIQQPSTVTNITIIPQQPGAVVPRTRGWKSGICGCFDDFGSCIIVCALAWFGCLECYGCHLSMRMNENCCLCGCVPGYLTALRTKLRIEQNIEGNICDDCVMTACCRPCAMCQMSRELDHCR